jgi:UDPglucose--hexose-1-phosphate uridylyltransferase
MSAGAHRRLNALTGEWVLVSPHRLDRPWQGETHTAAAAEDVAHDSFCYLCPGNKRAGGAENPRYEATFVFENDYPALLPHAASMHADGLFVCEPETGACRVLCYAPHHSQTLARMAPAGIRQVVDMWARQYEELAALPGVAAVTIFENRGAMMGASNPHPHGQVWATSSVPDELAKEDMQQRAHFAAHGRALLIDYLDRELELGSRIVAANDHFVALVPYWALWPFETLLLPRRAVSSLPALTSAERDALAELLPRLLAGYDKLFGVSAPYSMGWHQRPTQLPDAPHFVAHAHVCPPLVRPPNVRKFMVGFEMFAMPQRDLTPEFAAERLRGAMSAS